MLRLRHAQSYQTIWETGLAAKPNRPANYSSSAAAATLRTIWDVLREALAAHRQYEDLMARGLPHDTAIRRAFQRLKNR
jgi:hypothetical protein